MEEIQRLQASRRGHKSHLTKVLNKANEILKIDHSQANQMALTTLETALEQLTKKQQLIPSLDEKIAAKITDSKELETEIYESEELHYDLKEKINHIRKYIQLSSLLSQSNQPAQENQPSTLITSPETSPITHESPSTAVNTNDVSNETGGPPPTQQNSTNMSTQPSTQSSPTASVPPQNICRLPKLSLPIFSGNPLEWQSFWDSFDTAVHRNPTLTGIQRFNYLKAQLMGEALQTIAGFPLTNNNYDQAVNLLKDRFGQPHKIVNAHMHALLEVSPPSENLDSFRGFYDTTGCIKKK